MKYYAVRKGRVPGIYLDWDKCRAQVDRFSGAEFKSFSNKKDAEDYLNTSSTAFQPNTHNTTDFSKNEYLTANTEETDDPPF